jgi:antitoxin component YwqK of YwqJK toxin-antitoxin module
VKHGFYEEYYDYLEDRLKCRYSYRMGLLQGAYVKYFPDGNEAEIGQFVANKLHGQRFEYYPVAS